MNKREPMTARMRPQPPSAIGGRRLDYTVDIPVAVNRTPAGTRLGLRTWLRRPRRRPRRPGRIFWSLDPATGHWRRL